VRLLRGADAGRPAEVGRAVKLAFRRAIYRHNYRVARRWFPWLPKDTRWSPSPIVALCGDPKCPMCRKAK
jgi:hypothetical protein